MQDEQPSPAKPHVNFDVVALRNIARVGARRAALFMGLGLNAVGRDDVTDFHLHRVEDAKNPHAVPMEFLPAHATPEQLRGYKEEFATWLVSAGLRELIEHFSLMLDKVHESCLIALRFSDPARFQQLGGSSPAAMQKVFTDRLGVPAKLRKIRERFSVSTPHEQRIESLYRARNCLAHGLGSVTAKQTDGAAALEVQWLGYEFVGRGAESNTEVPWSEMKGNAFAEEMILLMRLIDRKATFSLGERIRFNHEELSQICFFVSHYATGTLLESFVDFMRSLGIPELQARAAEP